MSKANEATRLAQFNALEKKYNVIIENTESHSIYIFKPVIFQFLRSKYEIARIYIEQYNDPVIKYTAYGYPLTNTQISEYLSDMYKMKVILTFSSDFPYKSSCEYF